MKQRIKYLKQEIDDKKLNMGDRMYKIYYWRLEIGKLKIEDSRWVGWYFWEKASRDLCRRQW